jgi:hypothetical protein
MARHTHRCTDCPNEMTCTREDCQIDWQCPECADAEMTEWLMANGYQPDLPELRPEPLEM